MAREGVVPSATEVMAQHAPGGTGGAGRDGVVMVDWEAVRPDHWQRRLWPNATCSHGGPTDAIAGPALSGLCWPIRS